MSVFLGNLTVILPTKSQVGFIHNMPFDPENGIKDQNGNLMTTDQLNQIGILIDSIPDPQPPSGQSVSGIFVDPTTKTVTYEYADPPKTQDQIIADLQSQNAQMLFALVQGGLM